MKKKRGGLVILVVVLEILLALGALYGGGLLVAAPDGSLLGMPIAPLANTPFDTYLIPGLVLLVFIGIAPLLVAIATIKQLAWTRFAHLALGVTLVGFEIIEMAMIGYHLLQAIYIGYGLVLAILGLVIAKSGRPQPGTEAPISNSRQASP